MRRRLAHLAERLFNHAGRCQSIHFGTFDGWCWGQVQLAAAVIADRLDPIPKKGCRGGTP
jgi:hypothetical protein